MVNDFFFLYLMAFVLKKKIMFYFSECSNSFVYG